MSFYGITEEVALELYMDEVEAMKRLMSKFNKDLDEPISTRHRDNHME
jgi:hypothetical protein